VPSFSGRSVSKIFPYEYEIKETMSNPLPFHFGGCGRAPSAAVSSGLTEVVCELPNKIGREEFRIFNLKGHSPLQ
jgi:hypothetical protein